MIIKLLTKAGLAGGTIGGAIFVNEVTIDSSVFSSAQRSAEIKDKLNKSITTFKTLEDIEWYEKANGCKFSFVQSWNDGTVWNAKEFLENVKDKESVTLKIDEKEWVRRIIYSLNIEQNKIKCKEGKVVTLFHGNNVFMANDNLPARRK